MIYLQLFHRYIISDLINQKFLNQWVELFCILKCITYLVYQLKLSSMMQIHSVISIVQLKSAVSSDLNLYNWQSNVNSLFIENDVFINNNIIKTASSYKIKRLLDKHIRHHKHGWLIIKYLIKWKNYNHSHNIWYDIWDLVETKKLIMNYKQKATTTSIYKILDESSTWYLQQWDHQYCLKKDRLLWIDLFRMKWLECDLSDCLPILLLSWTYG